MADQTKVKIEQEFVVNDKDIEYMVITAFEGGINYWCVGADVKDRDYRGANDSIGALMKGAEIILCTDEGEVKSITKEKIAKAIGIVAIKYPKLYLKVKDGIVDISNHDASTADAVVQIAAFGELVYG